MKRAKHISSTEREYRKRKRREFKAVKKAIDDLELGCAFLPRHAYVELEKAMKHLEESYAWCKPWWRKA